MEELLTVAEVAEVLKVTQQTIRNWIDRGTLAHVRVGERRVRIPRRDVDALIAEQYTGTRSLQPMTPPSIWEGWIPDPVVPGDG